MTPLQNNLCSFIPTFSYGQEKEDSECLICKESLLENLTVPGQVPVKHEGYHGAMHPPAHLNCLRSWLEINNVCMLCQAPLDKQQLDLLFEELENVDLILTEPEELIKLAKKASEFAYTPEGNLRYLSKPLREIIKIIEEDYLNFQASNNVLIEYRNVITKHLETLQVTASESEYFAARSFFLNDEWFREMDPSVIDDEDALKNFFGNNLQSPLLNGVLSSKKIKKSFLTYKEAAITYIINEKTIHMRLPFTQKTLASIQKNSNPLEFSSQQEIKQFGQRFIELKNSYVQEVKVQEDCATTINALGDRLRSSLDFKIYLCAGLIFSTFLFGCCLAGFRYTGLHKEQECLVSSLYSSLSFLVFMKGNQIKKVMINPGKPRWKGEDFFIRNIDLPAKRAYRTFWG